MRWVFLGGFVAGLLDILFAWAFWAVKAGTPAMRVFQSVAAGVLGREAFTGGGSTAALGLLLHFTITTAMAFAYHLAALWLPMLVRRPIACGAAYGLFLFAFMRYVVVPLSAAGGPSKDPAWIGAMVAAHVALVGIPIAVACGRTRDPLPRPLNPPGSSGP